MESIEVGIIIIVVLVIAYWMNVFDDLWNQDYDCDSVDWIDVYSEWFEASSPLICFISGTHGNEPAGTVALNKLYHEGYFHGRMRARFRIISAVNPWGLAANKREDACGRDLNREYGHVTSLKSAKILELVKDAALVVDFHEGWGFHKIQPASIGSTITPTDAALALDVPQEALVSLNANIADDDKKFVMIAGATCNIPSSLGCALNNFPYMLVETTGQNNIQPMELRVAQIRTVCDAVMKHMTLPITN